MQIKHVLFAVAQSQRLPRALLYVSHVMCHVVNHMMSHLIMVIHKHTRNCSGKKNGQESGRTGEAGEDASSQVILIGDSSCARSLLISQVEDPEKRAYLVRNVLN